MTELEAQEGAPILTYGEEPRSSEELTRVRLVDEYRIDVHPIALGNGYRLFGGPDGSSA